MPIPANSTAFAVRGQAFNLSCAVRNSATGNPFTTGLGTLTAIVSIDDGTFVATTNAPVERGMSGWASLDLTPAEMTGSKIDVQIHSSQTGAVDFCYTIAPVDLSAQTQRYDLFAVLRLERLMLNLHDYLWNQQTDAGAAQRVYNANDQLMGQGVIVEGDLQGSRSKIV